MRARAATQSGSGGDRRAHDARAPEVRAVPRARGGALLGGAALLGVGLAVVGLYGLLVFVVRQRTREMGIRLALRAGPRDVTMLVLRRSFVICAWGIGLGFAAAWFASMVLARVLYGVSAHDVVAFAGAPLVLLLVVVTATLSPALAAGRVDPLVALRQDWAGPTADRRSAERWPG